MLSQADWYRCHYMTEEVSLMWLEVVCNGCVVFFPVVSNLCQLNTRLYIYRDEKNSLINLWKTPRRSVDLMIQNHSHQTYFGSMHRDEHKHHLYLCFLSLLFINTVNDQPDWTNTFLIKLWWAQLPCPSSSLKKYIVFFWKVVKDFV